MIAALLEAYRGSSVQTLSGDGWVFGSLVMRHKDFPFLQYEIRCRYSLEQQISYCENKSRKWLPLPDEWFSVISENRRSIGESQRLPKPSRKGMDFFPQSVIMKDNPRRNAAADRLLRF